MTCYVTIWIWSCSFWVSGFWVKSPKNVTLACKLFVFWQLNRPSSLHRPLSCWILMVSWSFVCLGVCLSVCSGRGYPSPVKSLIVHTCHSSSHHPASIRTPAHLSGFCWVLSSEMETLWLFSFASCWISLSRANQTNPLCHMTFPAAQTGLNSFFSLASSSGSTVHSQSISFFPPSKFYPGFSSAFKILTQQLDAPS